MKEKMIYVLLSLFLVVLAGAPALCAEEDSSGASGQAQEVYSDPSAFDGGAGSTLNEDSEKNSDSSVPDVGPSGPVGVSTDQQGDNYSD